MLIRSFIMDDIYKKFCWQGVEAACSVLQSTQMDGKITVGQFEHPGKSPPSTVIFKQIKGMASKNLREGCKKKITQKIPRNKGEDNDITNHITHMS